MEQFITPIYNHIARETVLITLHPDEILWIFPLWSPLGRILRYKVLLGIENKGICTYGILFI